MENQTPRKATDVLLDLESKLDAVLSIIKSLDLNMKLLSNKVNSLNEKLDRAPATTSFVKQSPQFTMEAVQSIPPQFMQQSDEESKQIAINSEYKLPVDESPIGFRRTSRPETYAGDNSYLHKQTPQEAIKFPTQVVKPPPGRGSGSEVIVPPQNVKQAKIVMPESAPPPQNQANKGAIPVEQRIVDKNGKSVFLADVEIVDLKTGQQVFKTRTNGAGKWAAPLAVGNYRVTINKRESITKQKVEVVQDIQVDGMTSPLTLNMIIIK